ncbi:MAG: hypothetical protein CL916_06045 [Deltaproteobacteria bacterium]|nr:hypothetical protein [Deltaproteobacteria bacterium]
MIFFFLSCFSMQRFDTPIPVQNIWRSTKSTHNFQQAWSYSQEHDGRALLILEGEELIFSAYAHPPQTPLPFWSGTKTLACFLAYDAKHKGLITLEEPVSSTITQWSTDPQKNTITIEDLLQFTSGLKQDFFVLSLDGFRPPNRQRVKDKYQFAINQPTEASARTTWSYGSVHLTVFAALFEKKTGMDIQDWLQKSIFPQIDFQYAGWNTDRKGQSMLAYGLWTTASELLKLGVLLRDDGMYQGKRVLPAGLQQFCAQSSSTNPAYGLGIWLNKDMPDHLDFPRPMFQKEGKTPIFHNSGEGILAFAGAKGQRIYVIPFYDWVVVHQAQEGDTFSDTEFLKHILPSTKP